MEDNGRFDIGEDEEEYFRSFMEQGQTFPTRRAGIIHTLLNKIGAPEFPEDVVGEKRRYSFWQLLDDAVGHRRGVLGHLGSAPLFIKKARTAFVEMDLRVRRMLRSR